MKLKNENIVKSQTAAYMVFPHSVTKGKLDYMTCIRNSSRLLTMCIVYRAVCSLIFHWVLDFHENQPHYTIQYTYPSYICMIIFLCALRIG